MIHTANVFKNIFERLKAGDAAQFVINLAQYKPATKAELFIRFRVTLIYNFSDAFNLKWISRVKKPPSATLNFIYEV